MSEMLQIAIIPAFITSIVTVVGFLVTYFLNKKNYKEEIEKQKSNIHLDEMADIPLEIVNLLDTILSKTSIKQLTPKMQSMILSRTVDMSY